MKTEKLFNIIQQAIEDQKKAHDFYHKAAIDISDPGIKATFERIANTELSHAEVLRKIYGDLRDLTS
jgi:rubrerythrin